MTGDHGWDKRHAGAFTHRSVSTSARSETQAEQLQAVIAAVGPARSVAVVVPIA